MGELSDLDMAKHQEEYNHMRIAMLKHAKEKAKVEAEQR